MSSWPRPRFVTPAGAPDLSVIGSNLAPVQHPINFVTRDPATGAASYERLFCDIGPNGKPVTYYHPGSFGMLVAAGRGWRR